jgi:hypothetical protein
MKKPDCRLLKKISEPGARKIGERRREPASRTDPAKIGQTCSDLPDGGKFFQFIAIDAQTFLTKMSHLLCIRIVCTGIEFRVSTAW